MHPNYRRAALLTGASFTALVLATPVVAAPIGTSESHQSSTKFASTESFAVQAAATGLRQEDVGTIAINLFEQQATDPAILFDATDNVVNPGGLADASAVISCAELSSACTQPGAFEQFADGQDSARNQIEIDGALSIRAIAEATGATATALALIEAGIRQQAISGGEAANALDVSGSIDISASANAVATNGPAGAFAVISQAMSLSAVGATAAAIDFSNSGSISIGVSANASAQGDGSQNAAAGAVAFGIGAFASATSAGPASITLANEGSIALDAEAHAIASGFALATAAAIAGINVGAAAVGDDASILIENAGDFSMSAEAQVAGGQTGLAIAQAGGGIVGFANTFGGGDASVTINNSGSLLLEAVAQAEATTTAIAIAIATSGMRASAFAATGNALLSMDNSGTLELMADAKATGQIAQATAVAGGSLFGGAVFQSVIASNGSATGLFANGGNIIIDGNAEANGSDLAVANVFGGPGVAQFVFATGGDANARIDNSGLIQLSAEADAVATGTAIANALQFRVVVGAAFADLAGIGGDASGELFNDGAIEVIADAHAEGGIAALARATVSVAVAAQGFNFGDGNAQASLVNSGSIEVDLNAVATGGTAFAIVTATNVVAEAVSNNGTGAAQVELFNEGSILVDANASANGLVATAAAFVDKGILQIGDAAGGVDLSIANSGTIELTASAVAHADEGGLGFAVATAAGIFQQATAASRGFFATTVVGVGTLNFTSDPSGPVVLQLANEGTISVAAHAAAQRGSSAQAIAVGATQAANGLTMDVSLNNSGTFDVIASASASGTDLASAQAVAAGILQNAAGIARITSVFQTTSESRFTDTSTSIVGNALVQLENSGTLSIVALADANSGSLAIAHAFATGVAQTATGTTAAAELNNSGNISVLADGHAAGLNAFASGSALGVNQIAVGSEEARVSLSNSGAINVGVVLEIDAEKFASGLAIATAVHQDPELIGGSAAAINDGTLTAAARVHAAGSTHADGQAFAAGIRQSPPFLGDFSGSLDNSGALLVLAEVEGQVDDGGLVFGAARATGYQLTGHSLLADVTNSGSIGVFASVDGLADAGSAQADAVGLDIIAFADSGVAGGLEATILNSGLIQVQAKVAGAEANAAASPIVAVSSASATGIRLASGSIEAVVTNSGSLIVEAISESGGNAKATGILAKDSAIVGAGTATLTINNSGDIIVRESTDGGSTWHRGSAIDLANAPNPSVINLLGGGVIYGDIAVQQGDQINVQGGQTNFYGIINPSAAPAAGLTAADLDSGLSGVGTLAIASGGHLFIADPRITGPSNLYDGPSYAFVDEFSVAAGGKISFELQPLSGGAQVTGSYSQLFADTANLDGTLIVNLATPNGLFEDSYSWNNVIDANVRNGTFDQCQFAGSLAGSVLLDFRCIYDDQANVDLSLTRVAFDAVAGLNRNGSAVAADIEFFYDPSLTGSIVAPLTDLFRIDDQVAYNVALNQLSGSAYANYLQSFSSLGVRYNDLLDQGANCEDQPLGGSKLSCRRTSGIHVWGQFDYERREADGDVEAGELEARRATSVVGFDTRIGNSFVVGLGAGFLTNHTRDDQFGDTIDGDGTLIGTYAVYDPGHFFAKAIVSYSRFDGDSRRRIDFGQLGTAASFSARPEGDPDAALFAASLHGGARFLFGSNSVVTPYLNLDYVSAEISGFKEAGAGGAELAIRDSRSSHGYLTSGVRFETKLGSILPEASIGYRHRFGDRRATVDAGFSGIAVSDFEIVSAAQARGSFLAGFGIGGKAGKVDLRISYDGEFNKDVTSHSGKLKLAVPLGGPRGK